VSQTETKKHFHIGSNVPGYLPESDVYCFDGTIEEAADCVYEQASDALESELEVHECDDPDCSPDNPTCKNIPYLSGIGGTNEQSRGSLQIWLENRRPHDLGIVFWALETDRTEDCEKENE